MMVDKSFDAEPLDVNMATADELAQLPGVGQALAERIVAGRPYEHVDDLSRVSGLGASTLEGFKDQVKAAARPSHQEPARRRDTPSAAAAPVPTYSKRQVAGLLAMSVILSIFLSIGLTLATLLGINGTLDIGRSRAVQDLQSQSGQLANQAQVLQGRLDAVDQRVQSLQGLTGRMSQVETRTSALADEVQAARADAQRLSQQVDDLEMTARGLEQRQARQESVFQALADLLAPWASTSAPTTTPPSTPTPGG